MKRALVAAALGFCILFLLPKSILAKSGCCSYHGGVSYCDTSVGTYVCNDGTYSPSCGCSYIPEPTYNPTPTFPSMTAAWKYQPNSSSNKTFNIEFTLNDSSPTQYSAVLSKCKGCNPGPLTDFYSNKFIYNNVAPGTWYLNVKKSIKNTWSTVSYWTITVPQWYEPSPTPTATPVSATNTQSGGQNPLMGGFVAIVLLIFAYGGIYILFKLIKWFLEYAKEHDGTWATLFWIGLIIAWILISIFSSNKNSTSTNSDSTSKYKCNCTKTCPSMTCAEAYFQLNECGCSARDGDNDGVPCEAQCR